MTNSVILTCEIAKGPLPRPLVCQDVVQFQSSLGRAELIKLVKTEDTIHGLLLADKNHSSVNMTLILTGGQTVPSSLTNLMNTLTDELDLKMGLRF